MNGYIELKNVAKAYLGQTLLQDINLSIAKGTTVGLVGANGSGGKDNLPYLASLR